MIEINFVSQRRKKLTKLEQSDRKIFKISIGLFTGVIVVFLVVIGLRFFLINQVAGLKTSQNSLKSQVVSQEEVERSFVIFVNKLKVLGELFSQRQDKQQAISFFSQVFGSEVLIKEISYDADSSLLTFGLKANDVFILENVFTTLSSEQALERFDTLSKSNLRRSLDGSYIVQVTVGLKEDK